MNPYADFTYFGLLLYAVVPTLILGFFGRANWRWALLVTVLGLTIQYQKAIWLLVAFGVWQWAIIYAFAAMKQRAGWRFCLTIALSLLPLAAAKFFPQGPIGFLGISYVTFRALDLVFCLRDGVITRPKLPEFVGFIFFFPTISAGPIDRYRRFTADWRRQRTREEFLVDLDGAVHRLFRGFLYKFIIAVLLKRFWLDVAANQSGALATLSYMYAYSFYLFFDFAGYSVFAIAISYLLGVHTPENFDRPFLARNIRDFWNRWHITLSFWFRDHIYMRFQLAAARGHWFRNRNLAAISGYFLAFGLMGLWHGPQWHFILYGLYHAVLLSIFHFVSANRPASDSFVRRALSIFVTFNCVCFGFLIFSGRLTAH